MNKHASRIVSFFLVPCLVGNVLLPTGAATFGKQEVELRASPSPMFSEEALAERAVASPIEEDSSGNVTRAILLHGISDTTIRAPAAMVAEKTDNSHQLIYNSGLSHRVANDLPSSSETSLVEEVNLNARLLRHFILQTAEDLALETGLPVAAEAYGGLFYLPDVTGYIPFNSLNDIDIQFSHFGNTQLEERFIQILNEKLSEVSTDVRANIVKADIRPTQFALVHKKSTHAIAFEFHRLVTVTLDDLIQDLSINVALGELFPEKRFLLVECLIGNPELFEQLRQRRLKGILFLDSTIQQRAEDLSRILHETISDPALYQVFKIQLLERIRYLNFNRQELAVAA